MIKMGELNQLLTKTARLHAKCTQIRLSKLDITPGQPRLLNFLYEHDGCVQKELSKNCDLKPATVTNILTGMEKAGLIFRLNDSADKRILRVFLTEKGVQAQQKIEKTFQSLEKECFEDFTDQEKEAAQIILRRIHFNLQQMNRMHT